jgi:hypothetical protein
MPEVIGMLPIGAGLFIDYKLYDCNQCSLPLRVRIMFVDGQKDNYRIENIATCCDSQNPVLDTPSEARLIDLAWVWLLNRGLRRS